MNAIAFQVFPYEIFSKRENAKRYQVRIKPEEDADASTVIVRTDFSLTDLVFHINQQDCEVLAIRRSGAWHEFN